MHTDAATKPRTKLLIFIRRGEGGKNGAKNEGLLLTSASTILVPQPSDYGAKRLKRIETSARLNATQMIALILRRPFIDLFAE